MRHLAGRPVSSSSDLRLCLCPGRGSTRSYAIADSGATCHCYPDPDSCPNANPYASTQAVAFGKPRRPARHGAGQG